MMGKRKRRADNDKTPPPSEFISHAPEVDIQFEQRSSERAETSATHPRPSIMDVMSGSNRALLLRHPRHAFSSQLLRQCSANFCDASPSNWKGPPHYDDAKLSFKLASKDLPGFQYRESRDYSFYRPERIRSSTLGLTAVPPDARKLECGLCQKRLRKKNFISEDSISLSDVSVVAMLVCGHAYHADCLEQNTRQEDRQDPPCPMCSSQIS